MLGALLMAVVGVDRQLAVRYHVFRTGSLSKPLVFSRGCGAKMVSEHPSGVISNNRKDVPSQLFSSLS
jgi:hypothetical protein